MAIGTVHRDSALSVQQETVCSTRTHKQVAKAGQRITGRTLTSINRRNRTALCRIVPPLFNQLVTTGVAALTHIYACDFDMNWLC